VTRAHRSQIGAPKAITSRRRRAEQLRRALFRRLGPQVHHQNARPDHLGQFLGALIRRHQVGRRKPHGPVGVWESSSVRATSRCDLGARHRCARARVRTGCVCSPSRCLPRWRCRNARHRSWRHHRLAQAFDVKPSSACRGVATWTLDLVRRSSTRCERPPRSGGRVCAGSVGTGPVVIPAGTASDATSIGHA
jgi:hypothetical protein